MNTYEAQIRVTTSPGSTLLVKTRIQAQDPYRARLLLEEQYGRGSVLGTPTASDPHPGSWGAKYKKQGDPRDEDQ